MNTETCQNPFTEHKCKSTNIKLYIQVNGERLPICENCWNKIADSKEEWSSTPPPHGENKNEQSF